MWRPSALELGLPGLGVIPGHSVKPWQKQNGGYAIWIYMGFIWINMDLYGIYMVLYGFIWDLYGIYVRYLWIYMGFM